MTEKESFLNVWEAEYKTSVNVVKAYPEGKLDLKPAEKLRPAREIMWTVIGCDFFTDMVLKEKLMEMAPPEPPSTIKEMVDKGTTIHADVVAKIKKMSDAEFTKMTKFYTAPGKMGDVPMNQVLWSIVFDHIHHRGQLSVYERIAGGIVPSIYGPTAEEPW